MLKKQLIFASLVLGVSLACNAWAAPNFAGMSSVELGQLRQQMRTAPPEERNAFESEWQKRLQAMPLEVKQRHYPDELRRADKMQKTQGNSRP